MKYRKLKKLAKRRWYGPKHIMRNELHTPRRLRAKALAIFLKSLPFNKRHKHWKL